VECTSMHTTCSSVSLEYARASVHTLAVASCEGISSPIGGLFEIPTGPQVDAYDERQQRSSLCLHCRSDNTDSETACFNKDVDRTSYEADVPMPRMQLAVSCHNKQSGWGV